MIDKASDLLTECHYAVYSGVANQWTTVTFSRQYNNPDSDKNSIKTDAILIYCNASLRDNAVKAYFSMIYYIGVCYLLFNLMSLTSDKGLL